MSQSIASVKVHVVFSTKYRAPLITPDIRNECHSYLASIARRQMCRVYEIGGMPDHVHMLITLPRTVALATLMERIKSCSSKWLRTKGHPAFSWQNGYGVFSVGESKVDCVRRYIRNQEIHHRTASFQQEYRTFLKTSNVDIDDHLLWD